MPHRAWSAPNLVNGPQTFDFFPLINSPMNPARYLVVASFLTAGICAASPPPSPPRSAERIVTERTGKAAAWERDQDARAAARKVVDALLARPLTASSAAQIALLNNRSLQASFEEIGISQGDLIEAGLLKNPTVEASIRFPNSPSDLQGSLVADLLDALFLPLRKRVARAQLERTTLRVADEALKLATETQVAFLEAQAQQHLLAGMTARREAAEAARDLSQRQHEAGNVSDLELATNQATYTEARLALATAEAELREKRERLNRLMGLWDSDRNWVMSSEMPMLSAGEPSAARLEAVALEQRLDLAAAKAELASVAHALGLTKAYRFLGTFDIGIASERDADHNTRTGPMLRLELPIFNQGQGRVARGEAQLRQAADRVEALAAEIRSEVRERRERVVAKRELAALYREELLPQRRQIVNLTLLHYNAMFVGPFDLLEAKESELEAERSGLQAMRDYWIARAELERAVGGNLHASLSAESSPALAAKGSAKHAKQASVTKTK